MTLIKVSSSTNCSSCAGAISQQLREGNAADVQVIGAGALNQAVKAIIIAKGHLAPLGFDLVCRPAFVNLEVEGKERTGIRLTVTNEARGIKYDKPKDVGAGSKAKAGKRKKPKAKELSTE